MKWLLSPLNSLRRFSRPARRAPNRNRSLIVEDLEGRRLLSQGIQSILSLPTDGTTNIISGPDGNLWVGLNTSPNPTTPAPRSSESD